MPKPHARPTGAAANQRFEQMFLEHHASVVAYVRRRAPAEAVDDAVDETFLVAWRRLSRVPEEPLPWLLGVARNVLATQRRGSRRRDALITRLRGAEPPPAAPPPAAAERDSHVLDVLARLSPKDREALTLVAWDGLSPQEAASVLREAPGTFRVRLHRARQRFQRELEQGGGEAMAVAPVADKTLRIGGPVHD